MASSGGLEYNGPLNPNPAEGESRISIYGYYPSLAVALCGLITFALASGGHTFWAIRKGKMYRTFHILMAVGCKPAVMLHELMVITFPFVLTTLLFFLLVVAPVLFTAAIDLTLNILVQGIAGTERILLLKPRTVLIIFVTSDAVCIVVQIAGAALVGITQSARAENRSVSVTPEQASDILLAGLAMQIASWVIFLVFLLVAIWRAYAPPTDDQYLRSKGYRPTRMLLLEILAVTLLILLRACYRLSETALGFFTSIASVEVAFALLEYLPVILAVGILAIFPPSFYVEHRLSRDITETARGPADKEGLRAGSGIPTPSRVAQGTSSDETLDTVARPA